MIVPHLRRHPYPSGASNLDGDLPGLRVGFHFSLRTLRDNLEAMKSGISLFRARVNLPPDFHLTT